MSESKRMMLVLAVGLMLVCGVETDASVEKHAVMSRLPAAQQQSQELEEAVQLSASVAKLYREGKYDEALPLAKRVLEIREKALGPEHVLLGEALFNLAELYLAKNKFKEAEPLYQRLVAYYEKAVGPEHAKTLSAIERLAYISFRRDEYKEAEKLLLRAFAVYEKFSGPELKQAERLALELAQLYRIQKENSKAESMYLRAIELDDKIEDKSNESEPLYASSRYLCFIYETRGADEGKKREKQMVEARAKAREEKAKQSADVENKIDGGALNGGVINGRAISKPVPSYPDDAKSRRIQGSVILQITVDEGGQVIKAKTICGPQALREVSERAALKARFTPTLLSGRAVKVSGIITYHFSLR